MVINNSACYSSKSVGGRLFGTFGGCSKESCSSQAWSEQQKQKWYRVVEQAKLFLTRTQTVLRCHPIPCQLNMPQELYIYSLMTLLRCCINAARLKSAGVPLRLCSNTSTKSPLSVAHTLNSLGFDISPDEVYTPIPAVKHYLRQNKLRPFVIVDPGEQYTSLLTVSATNV